MPTATYGQLQSRYSSQHERLRNVLGWISFARLASFISAIALGYFYLTRDNGVYLAACIAATGLFLWLIRYYSVIERRADFTRELLRINKDELAFLAGTPLDLPNGAEYMDPQHPYSYDLDMFGNKSLFAYLNRASTPFGTARLARSILAPEIDKVKMRQDAIAELRDKLDFRQKLQAYGSIHKAREKDLQQLQNWLAAPATFSKRVYYLILLLFPAAALVSLGLYFSSGKDLHLNLFFALFALNLFITSFFIRKVLKQVSLSTAVTRVLEQFGGQLRMIEGEAFQSPLLKSLQSALQQDQETAGESIRKLSTSFRYMDFILNLVVSSFLNGLFLFHVHVLYGNDRWRRKRGPGVMGWLETIGDFEELSSYANFAFNNRDYCTPVLKDTPTLAATDIFHPLIMNGKGIGNDIDFREEQLLILTGSNMSGKSTFLRTIGVNLVLARAGSVVCATGFSFYPFDLYVSMRITDSLQDSESFFYAELKRLQRIIHNLEKNPNTLVLLDEILRGTNSNDKHNGTIGLIRKLAAHKAFCIVATHDLTVAALASEYPGYMGNRCFESTIVNDELYFDYKLKSGVCSRLNATFLMKKMGVIE